MTQKTARGVGRLIRKSFLQMPQINAVLPQIIFFYGLDDLIKGRSKGFFILWQRSLELKCIGRA